ncbi:Predicted nuclease of the RNAse H fold, HicB family [Paenibacillus barengoltzii]|jgi:predicted RNase H-like HicB family nuclease|uniref:type II toxin-antitoxin system HicB family antitoxin n=1 Tax=Paenibacillus barengoltzii TaxID=343517 RepID=UPI000A0875DB|nr:type II toxin-antitoxin system HicB family antitoxin [Paenibacillus barengoltzii]SMF59485.1 Predicted nuclease of the RNAse H fold, HicB family [Paenibacillus barengoltzii]
MSQKVQEQGFTIMIEQDKADNNFTAYIPALRLGAVGDTLEEVRENARDLLLMEIESLRKNGKELPEENCIVETLTIELPV